VSPNKNAGTLQVTLISEQRWSFFNWLTIHFGHLAFTKSKKIIIGYIFISSKFTDYIIKYVGRNSASKNKGWELTLTPWYLLDADHPDYIRRTRTNNDQ